MTETEDFHPRFGHGMRLVDEPYEDTSIFPHNFAIENYYGCPGWCGKIPGSGHYMFDTDERVNNFERSEYNRQVVIKFTFPYAPIRYEIYDFTKFLAHYPTSKLCMSPTIRFMLNGSYGGTNLTESYFVQIDFVKYGEPPPGRLSRYIMTRYNSQKLCVPDLIIQNKSCGDGPICPYCNETINIEDENFFISCCKHAMHHICLWSYLESIGQIGRMVHNYCGHGIRYAKPFPCYTCGRIQNI